MRKFTLTALLILSCVLTNVDALTNGSEKTETIRGKIAMDLPDASAPKIVINLDKTFFNLLINFGIASLPKSDGDPPMDMTAYTAYADMLKGAAVRAYDKETGDINQIIDHYQSALEAEKWEHIVKVKDEFDLSLLYGEEPGIIYGIFVTITDDEGWGFANIYGEIDFQKLGVLFGHFLESNPEEMIRDWLDDPKPQWWKAQFDAEAADKAPKSKPETDDPSK